LIESLELKETFMAGKNIAVFGIYRDRASVEEAVEALRAAGYRNTDISVLFPDNQGTKDFAHEKHTKAPEGTATGATAGGVIGGTLGWLVGIGALAIPGVGPFIAAGPIVAALAGVGAGGVLGGIVGALAGLGVPEYEAKRYEGRIKEGGILLSVHCDNSEWVKRAKDLLEHTGAADIASAGEESADFATSDKPLPRLRRTDPLADTDVTDGPVTERVPLTGTRITDRPLSDRPIIDRRPTDSSVTETEELKYDETLPRTRGSGGGSSDL
jgi:hypothetical protein